MNEPMCARAQSLMPCPRVLTRAQNATASAASAAEARRAGSEAVREAIEAARTEDSVLDAAVAELQSSFPAILRPLVWERDVYLAWSLKRSKAVCGTKAVVGVVGKGHLRGVVHALKADHGDLRFKDLTGGAVSALRNLLCGASVRTRCVCCSPTRAPAHGIGRVSSSDADDVAHLVAKSCGRLASRSARG